MNALILGSSGFVGRHLKARLLRDDHTVIDGTRNYHFIPDLLLDEPPIDVIVNCAGEITEPHRMYESNVALVEKLLRFARDAKIPKVIHLGSSSEYGSTTEPRREDARCVPTDLYSATKLAATQLCQGFARQYDMDVCVARPFSLYGPGDTPRKLIPRLIRAYHEDGEITVYNGGHDWLFIQDFLDGIVTLINAPASKTQGDIVNFGTGVSHTNHQVVNRLEEALQDNVYVTFKDEMGKAYDTHCWMADISKVRHKYGWSPKYDLVAGLRETVRESSSGS